MRTLLLFITGLFLYVMVLSPLVDYLDNRPFVEQLGYVPQESFLRYTSADQKHSLAAGLVFKTMMYFGGLIAESTEQKVFIPPDYDGMVQNIKSAVKLDPYNMDSYYFAQAILTWDVGRIEEANKVLEYGMNYRDWDFYLPYFAGFNYAYFLKDYDSAAKYYRRAAELTGSDLLMRLTSRYLYEAKQTDLAIAYLKSILETGRNQAVKTSLQLRLQALEGIKAIELAMDIFKQEYKRQPQTIEELVVTGHLDVIPLDPYGGKFYISKNGRVETSSKMAGTGNGNVRD